MQAARCAICGRAAVALHHVVAKCHSQRAVLAVCEKCHKELDGSLYYAGVHRRDRPSAADADRDYALVRGTSDIHVAMWRAAGSDPRLIELIGRAQYSIGRLLAAEVSPERRIGPQPPTSGAFRIKVGRLNAPQGRQVKRSTSPPDWLDRWVSLCSMWAQLIGDYSGDRALAQFFSNVAAGLANGDLRAWVDNYREQEFDALAEVLQRDLSEYVQAVLESVSTASGESAVSGRVLESARVLAAHFESALSLMRDLASSRTERSARSAVDAFLTRETAR